MFKNETKLSKIYLFFIQFILLYASLESRINRESQDWFHQLLFWAKTKVNFVMIWKIFIYLSKSFSSPSKYPPDILHLCQRFFQSSKHLLNSTSGIALKAFFDSTCIPSIVSKRCPRSGLLSLGNSQKSDGVKSGEYGGCGSICVEFLAKWSIRTSAVWDGALSWCKNQELSAQIIFWNGVEWSS